MVEAHGSTKHPPKIRRIATDISLTTTFKFLQKSMRGSHYPLLGDALMTKVSTDTEARYTEEQEELDFLALITSDREAQKIRTEIDNFTVAVKYCENEQDLSDTYIPAVVLLKLEHEPKRRINYLPSCSTGGFQRKRCPSSPKAAPKDNGT